MRRGMFVVAVVVLGLLLAGQATSVFAAPPPHPEVSTDSAEPLGMTGLSVNGTIHPHGHVTSYYVEYGPTAELGKRTKPQPLPPALTAYYHESWDANAGGWLGGMSAKGDDAKHHPEGGASGGFLRFSEPSGNDPNHVDGIGTLHLCKYVYPGLLNGANGTMMLGGGDPDFRNARVTISVRGNQWQANGSELVWWTQSQRNIELGFGADWRRANWAYSGHSLTPLLASGKWEKSEYRLRNDSTQWTYGGNNLAQKRPNYAYWPIDDSQRHLNNDFFHLLTFVDPAKLPQGSIDFDELTVAYHNYSLLIPSNGGRLVGRPEGTSEEAANRLTDGWRHGVDHVWKSSANPSAPQAFTWKFDSPVSIEGIQVHQSHEKPSKTVVVAVSQDGTVWTPLKTLEIPESSPHGFNYAYAYAKTAPTKAAFVRFSVTAGCKSDAWSLGEVEVFGTGERMVPEDEPQPVTLDLSDLEPGKPCHYRFVATTDAQTVFGKTQTISVPATTAPHVVTQAATRLTGTTARLEGRLNPMGQRTQFWFEYGPDTRYGQKTAETYGGLQITPRLAASLLSGLKSGTTYHYRLVAKNETGMSQGADTTFTTP
ncbi:MAG: discoidin domain-containing protein [Planctomycetaceae bacterium]|nr:discoidin domain-containing protein [Planctomycetaceae bacterium]